MTILSFPTPTYQGQTFFAQNGITYTWDGEKWTVEGAQAGSIGYILPPASNSRLGGVTVGTNINVDLNGVISIPNQTQADWNETDSTHIDYIKNKPTNVSTFTNDANYITSTSLTWNNITNAPNFAVLPTSTAGYLYNNGTGTLSWNTPSVGNGSTLVNGDYTVSLGVDGYLNLPNGSDGLGALLQSASPIRINSNQNFWTFGTDGTTTLPGGLVIGNSNDRLTLNGNFEIGAYSNNTRLQPTQTDATVEIATLNSNDVMDPSIWTFGTDGYLTFPNGTLIGSLEGSAGIFGPNGTDFLINTRFDNTGSYQAWTFGTDGVLTMPDGSLGGNGAINFNWEGYNWASISSSESTLNLYSLDVVGNGPKTNVRIGYNVELTTNALDTAYTWTFDNNGSLTVPTKTWSKTFSAVLLPVYGFAPDIGPYGGDAWTLDVTFTADAHDVVSTTVAQIFPIQNNPGYKTGDTYTFTETAHGIAGYTLTIVLNNVEYPGFAGWTANVECSAPPVSPSTINSLNAIKLTSNSNDWTFGTDGTLTVPADSTIKSASGNLNLFATNNVNIESKGHTFVFDTDTVGRFIMPPGGVIAGNGLNIFTGNIDTEVGNYWEFGTDGTLSLPNGTNIYGDGIFQADAVGGFELNSFTDNIGGGKKTWTFGTDGSLTLPETSAINISGSSGGFFATGDTDFNVDLNGKHWSFDAGSGQTYLPFGLTVAGDISNSEDLVLKAGQETWTFGTDGTTKLPDQSIIRTQTWGAFSLKSDNADIVIMTDVDNSRGWIFGVGGNLTLPASGVIKNSDGSTYGGTTYTLPAATSSVLGGVKVGSNISVTLDGTISVAAPFSGNYDDLTNKPTLTTGPKGDKGDTGATGPQGPAGNATGSILVSTNASGDEGGEVDLAKSPNSSLSGSQVVIDQYIDRIRFFEAGGTTRGAYIDLSQAAAGVGTLLNNRVSAFVNAGTFVTMDNIKATVTTGGQRGLSLATVSGTATCYIGGTYGSGVGSGGASAGFSMTTAPSASIFSWNFPGEGDVATYVLNYAYTKAYRITVMIGGAYNNNMISIERLV